LLEEKLKTNPTLLEDMEDTSSQLSALRSEIALLKQTNKNLEKVLNQKQRDATEAQGRLFASSGGGAHNDGKALVS
jgi:phage shock protein A